MMNTKYAEVRRTRSRPKSSSEFNQINNNINT